MFLCHLIDFSSIEAEFRASYLNVLNRPLTHLEWRIREQREEGNKGRYIVTLPMQELDNRIINPIVRSETSIANWAPWWERDLLTIAEPKRSKSRSDFQGNEGPSTLGRTFIDVSLSFDRLPFNLSGISGELRPNGELWTFWVGRWLTH